MPEHRGIRRHLYQALFHNPQPLHAKAYAEAQSIMFPDRTLFVHFLQTDSIDEQTELAKIILQRICHSLPVSIPYTLLTNLLISEDNLRAQPPHGFVDRDHVLHLVYLYLLGLFLFAYHPPLHNALMARMKTLRRIHSYHVKSHLVSQFDVGWTDLVRSWQMFVTTHDVGYPFERQVGPKEFAELLKPFQSIAATYQFDIVLRILSKLLAIRSFVAPSTNHVFGDDVSLEQFAKATLMLSEGGALSASDASAHYERLRSATACGYIAGARFLSDVLAIRPETRTIAVLIDSSTAAPVMVIAPKVASKKEFDIFVLKNGGFPVDFSPEDVLGAAFCYGATKSERLSWQYYALDSAKDYDAFCTGLFGTLGLKDEFYKLEQYVRTLSPLSVSMASSDNEYQTYLLHIYQELMTLIECDSSGGVMHGHWVTTGKTPEDRIRPYVRPGVDTVVNALRSILLERLEKEPLRGKWVTGRSNIEALVKYYLGGFRSIDALVGALIPAVDSVVGERIKNGLSLQSMLTGLTELLPFFGREETKAVVDLRKPGILDEAVLESRARCIDPVLKGSLGCGAVEAAGYRPSWADGERPFLDHGIASAIALLEVRHLVETAVAQVPGSPDGSCLVPALRLALGIDPVGGAKKVSFFLDRLVPEVANAVMVHNLYPRDLGKIGVGSSFRVSLSQSPFAYACLLSDCLQCWGRPNLGNRGRGRPTPGVSADDWDVNIDGNFLLISERGRHVNISKRLEEFRVHLSEWLEGGGDFVRLSLTEW